jgi:hypothetical protein
MSEPKIRRKFKAVSVTLSTATAAATTLRWDDVAGGTLEMGTVSTAASTIQVWASESESTAFGRLYNTDGSVADITLTPSTAVGGVYSLPDAVFGVPFLEVIVGNTAGTGVACTITMKS